MSARPTTSASNLHRRKLCPGSEHAEAPYHGDGALAHEDDSSEESREGDMLHELAADPRLPREHLNAEQARALVRCAALEAYIIEQIKVGHFAAQEGLDYIEGSEAELAMHFGLRVVFTGHCDYWRYYPAHKVLVILDRKFGRIEVDDAAENYQLRAYAVQGAERWDCEAVFCAIVQPRIYSEAPPTVAYYTRTDLTAARTEVLAILAACKPLDAPRIASEDACKYCRAAGPCPQYQAQITAPVPLVGVPAVVLTNEQLAVCLHAISMLSDKWVAEIKDVARARIAAGEFPGYVLKDNAPRREITDSGAAFLMLREAGFTDDDLFAVAKLSVGEADKLYRGRGMNEKEAKTALAEALAGVLIARPVAPSIKLAA